MAKHALFEGKPYDPKKTEERIYQQWEKSGFFNPDNLPGNPRENYIIYMPLPNVTGSLHMGHALDNSLQDILARFWRMRGKRVLWLPGTDHAGISTQYIVEKQLKKEGKTRFDLGREKFIERVWQWKEECGNIIYDQLRRLGASCDWSRARFTMDEAYAKDVANAFIHYHKKGFLYRGMRTVNWCPRCGTTLSELELEYEEEKSNLWYFRYPFSQNSQSNTQDCIVVATTRPETMFGDVAVAVNPNDERWKKYVGKTVLLPIQNREIPIVGDEMVDSEFGTGAVKVTPAHDVSDFQLAERHKLPSIQVIDEHGKMSAKIGKEFEKLKSTEAREKVIQMMNALGLLEKTEEYTHRKAKCARCGHAIEPIPSKQWFIKMDHLAKETQRALEKRKVKIYPENFERTALVWLENIRDWTVSRQLWWGHRLPVWFEEKKPDYYVVSAEKPKGDYIQSEDVLDTWFSSALWPFAGFSETDRKKYYPGNVLITARDIVNLWVSRMIFSGLEFLGQVPFRDVFIHGTILTKEGKRMSKSLGTGTDPLKYIEQYGSDVTRFAVIWQATGQDIRWDETAITGGKKFMNKLWNASRFVLTKTQDMKHETQSNLSPQTEADKKILASLKSVSECVEKNVKNFEFSSALKNTYDFFWHDFCDIYIEESKRQLEEEKNCENTKKILNAVLYKTLILLHPFIPFITEEIFGALQNKKDELLMIHQVI